jgi:lycopene cyclase domain-containing protein
VAGGPGAWDGARWPWGAVADVDRYQYLIVMGGCLALTAPLEFLGPRVWRRSARLARAVLPVALAFLIWDAVAIAAGVWTYNPRYITGVRLPFRIPVEELVFFLVIPVCGILAYCSVQVVLARRRAGKLRGARRAVRG